MFSMVKASSDKSLFGQMSQWKLFLEQLSPRTKDSLDNCSLYKGVHTCCFCILSPQPQIKLYCQAQLQLQLSWGLA